MPGTNTKPSAGPRQQAAVDPPPEDVGSHTTDTIDADPDDMISQPVRPEDDVGYGEVLDTIDSDVDHGFTPAD
ncbi:MAG: hypothetical protein AAGF73_06020 [Actinomycetota bacterium]